MEVFKNAVIIGNGPSGICLSYMLSGNWPFYNGQPHHIDFLQCRLEEKKDISIMEQDLCALSEGLEGRSFNPVPVLFDTLVHPLADFGTESPSVIKWMWNSECTVDHVVLGKGPVGGIWQKMDGNARTVSLCSWMELPGLTMHSWAQKTNRLNVSFLVSRQKRATAKSVAKYYHHYVEYMMLKQYFVDNAVVTSVLQVTNARKKFSSASHNFDTLWKVSGHLTNTDTSSVFTYVTPHVILATGKSDRPNRLNVSGEDMPFVLHSLEELENRIRHGELSRSSGNLMIVGAGLSAADAVITARFHGVSIIHVFRCSVHDPKLIFNKLSQNIYPEYYKVHQMMKDSKQGYYEGYESFPLHNVQEIRANKTVILLSNTIEGSMSEVTVSHILILIGMNPDLSFLPDGGKCLGVYPNLLVDCKTNPVDIDAYTHESVHHHGLYAIGPLVGDNFVRFVQGGCLAVASHIHGKSVK